MTSSDFSSAVGRPLVLLGIESSCDETAACVLVGGRLRKSVVATQLSHGAHGGVIPEIAARLHEKNITRVVQEAIGQSNLSKKNIHAVAATQGPGLMGALLVGFSFAKALAWSLRVPLIAVHHLRAHVASLFLTAPHPSFPFLCLLVSGGHTHLLRVDSHQESHLLGQTKDDSVGEAFDKIARLLEFPYPGGQYIDRLARSGDPRKFSFPKPSVPGLDYSFSGLKTSFLYFIRAQMAKDPSFLSLHAKDLAASIQHVLVESLLEKLSRAVRATSIREIGLVGGVAANSYLRARLQQLQQEQGWRVFFPEPVHCTDNAAMVALQGFFQYQAGVFSSSNQTPFARAQTEAPRGQ